MDAMDAMDAATHSEEIAPQVCRPTILRSAMIFLQTNGLTQEQDKPVASATYKCESGQLCDFRSVFTAVDASQDYLAGGVRPMLLEIINDIKDHQDAYNPARVDDFMISRDGNNLIHFTREGAKRDGRTGVLEYNTYRHAMAEEARTSRIIAEIKLSSRQTKTCVVM